MFYMPTQTAGHKEPGTRAEESTHVYIRYRVEHIPVHKSSCSRKEP